MIRIVLVAFAIHTTPETMKLVDYSKHYRPSYFKYLENPTPKRWWLGEEN